MQVIDLTDKKHQKLFAAIYWKQKMVDDWKIIFKKVFGTNIDELGYDGTFDATFTRADVSTMEFKSILDEYVFPAIELISMKDIGVDIMNKLLVSTITAFENE